MHCLRASLSEHDFDSVGGASGRAGLRRTTPRWEKHARPSRRRSGVAEEEDELKLSALATAFRSIRCGGSGDSHGEASSCADMVSSMEASPQGASEQYICMVTSSLQMKGR